MPCNVFSDVTSNCIVNPIGYNFIVQIHKSNVELDIENFFRTYCLLHNNIGRMSLISLFIQKLTISLKKDQNMMYENLRGSLDCTICRIL